jgi:hypothetical protein
LRCGSAKTANEKRKSTTVPELAEGLPPALSLPVLPLVQLGSRVSKGRREG